VLDVDLKLPEGNGNDTLGELGFGVLPNTAMMLPAAALLGRSYARIVEVRDAAA
jgi:hypothetical protein